MLGKQFVCRQLCGLPARVTVANPWDSKKGATSLSDRENILSALREKPLKVFEIMRRANVMNEESCQSLLLKMRDEGSIKFDIHKGRWFIV
jgi:hypothetical protein